MNECDDCISLSDDDTVVEELQVTSESTSRRTQKTNHTSAIETIVIEEDVVPTATDSDTVIVLSDSQNSAQDNFTQSLNVIRKEDPIFASLIDLCLNLENSDGMRRIIQRTVMKSYAECDNEYIKSEKFLKLALKTISQIENDPDHKFSHIKNFVQSLRTHKFKKKVDFITLATNLKGKVTPGLTSKSKPKKSQSINNNNSIILDSDEDIPAVNLDDNPNKIICLDDESEKENHKMEKTSDETDQNFSRIPPVDLEENPNKIICLDDESEKENHRTENNSCNADENFLEPQSSQGSFTMVEPTELPIEYEPQSRKSELNPDVLEKIKSIEVRIASFKQQIQVLEEMEVNDDSNSSPYILSDSYKASVVKLYKELCDLLGQQPVKKRKVRLKVLDGHPSGPVKRLEAFINNNIGEDGSPLFPDFCDVVKCVMVASVEDNLGWNKQQIMREANSLFIQCGRALQKKRQKREYRDLLARVKQEDHDPADDDPELQRRLEINRRAGVKKEMDLLERFSLIQDLPQRPKSGSILEEIFTNNHEPSCSNHALVNEQSSINHLKSPTVDAFNGQSVGSSDKEQVNLKKSPTNEQNTVIKIPKTISNCLLVIDPGTSGPYMLENVPIGNGNATVISNTRLSSDRVIDNELVNSEPICTNETVDLGSKRTVGVSYQPNVNHEENEKSNLEYDRNDKQINSSVAMDYKPCNGNEEVINTNDKKINESEINVNLHEDQITNPCLGIIVNESVQSLCCNDIISDEDSKEAPNIALLDKQSKETDVNTQADLPNSPYSDIIISDEDSNFEPPEIPLTLPIKDEIMDSESNIETENHETIVKAEVKPEPMDIVKMLEELGDDYTTSVIDIEDPFLVIDISSDDNSSEDEMELDDDEIL